MTSSHCEGLEISYKEEDVTLVFYILLYRVVSYYFQDNNGFHLEYREQFAIGQSKKVIGPLIWASVYIAQLNEKFTIFFLNVRGISFKMGEINHHNINRQKKNT